MDKIIIWDESAQRINNMHKNLSRALKELGLKAEIQSMSEPPLLSRTQMYGTTPAIEIDGEIWRLHAGKEIVYEEFLQLLKKVNSPV